MKVVVEQSIETTHVERLFEEVRGLGLKIDRTTGSEKGFIYFEVEGFVDRLELKPRLSKHTKEVVGYTINLPWHSGPCFQVAFPTRPDGTFKYDKIAAEIARRFRNAKVFKDRVNGVLPSNGSPVIDSLIEEYGHPPSWVSLEASPHPNRIRVTLRNEADFSKDQMRTLMLAFMAVM